MKKLILCFFMFVFLYFSLAQAQEISLSLDEAWAIALRDNRDILLKSEEVKKAKEKIAEATAGFFPALNFTAGQTVTRGLYTKDLSQTTTQTTLKQYLYKGGKTINTIKYNGYKFEVAEAVLDKAKLDTLLNVRKAYYTFLLAKEFADINKGILENAQAHLDLLRARYAFGQASESDVLKIESSLSSVKQAYEESLNQIESSLALLNNLLYLDEGVQLKPKAEFICDAKEVAYDEAFLKAMKTRPEIRQYEAQEQADKRSIEIAKAESRPNVYASWDYYSRSHLAATTTRNSNDNNILGLTFSWPIFDGWATKAKVEQAIIDLKETQLTREKTIKDIALELRNAYLDLKNAVSKMRSMQAQIDIYKDTLKVTQEKYKNGLASSLDLDDAKLGYQVSLFNHQQAIFDYIIAKAEFDKATGG